MLRFVVSLIISVALFSAKAQDSSRVSTLQLNEGIYFNNKQLCRNAPLPFTRFILPEGISPRAYLCDAVSGSSLQYYDEYGILQTIPLDVVWGFCCDGAAFINVGGFFARIQIFGSLSYFVANVTVRYEAPAPNISYSYGYVPMRTQSAVELRQYIVELHSGNYAECNSTNLLRFLQSDSDLYQQYNALSNAQKNKQILVYLRRYNSLHPLQLK